MITLKIVYLGRRFYLKKLFNNFLNMTLTLSFRRVERSLWRDKLPGV